MQLNVALEYQMRSYRDCGIRKMKKNKKKYTMKTNGKGNYNKNRDINKEEEIVDFLHVVFGGAYQEHKIRKLYSKFQIRTENK